MGKIFDGFETIKANYLSSGDEKMAELQFNGFLSDVNQARSNFDLAEIAFRGIDALERILVRAKWKNQFKKIQPYMDTESSSEVSLFSMLIGSVLLNQDLTEAYRDEFNQMLERYFGTDGAHILIGKMLDNRKAIIERTIDNAAKQNQEMVLRQVDHLKQSTKNTVFADVIGTMVDEVCHQKGIVF